MALQTIAKGEEALLVCYVRNILTPRIIIQKAKKDSNVQCLAFERYEHSLQESNSMDIGFWLDS